MRLSFLGLIGIDHIQMLGSTHVHAEPILEPVPDVEENNVESPIVHAEVGTPKVSTSDANPSNSGHVEPASTGPIHSATPVDEEMDTFGDMDPSSDDLKPKESSDVPVVHVDANLASTHSVSSMAPIHPVNTEDENVKSDESLDSVSVPVKSDEDVSPERTHDVVPDENAKINSTKSDDDEQSDMHVAKDVYPELAFDSALHKNTESITHSEEEHSDVSAAPAVDENAMSITQRGDEKDVLADSAKETMSEDVTDLIPTTIEESAPLQAHGASVVNADNSFAKMLSLLYGDSIDSFADDAVEGTKRDVLLVDCTSPSEDADFKVNIVTTLCPFLRSDGPCGPVRHPSYEAEDEKLFCSAECLPHIDSLLKALPRRNSLAHKHEAAVFRSVGVSLISQYCVDCRSGCYLPV